MNCPSCHETVEDNASYCGNCGHFLGRTTTALGALGVTNSVPAGSAVNETRHRGRNRLKAALILGLIGLAGAFFVPVIGLTLGLLGVALATSTRVTARRTVKSIGLALSALAILAGLASWVYAVNSDPRFNSHLPKAKPADSSTESAADLSTPCYSLSFIDELNIDHGKGDCDINAYNGSTLTNSTNAYKVIASKVDVATVNDFTNLAKRAVEKDVAQSLKGFHVDSEKVASFAGSPAYVVNASDKTDNVSVIEAAVLHEVANGNNVFVLVHANNGDSADLQILESNWQWK